MVCGLEKIPASSAAAAQAKPRKKATSGARERPNMPCKLLISKRPSHPGENESSPRVSPQAWQKAAPGTYSAPHSGQADAKPAGEGWKGTVFSAGGGQKCWVALGGASGIKG